jgi:flagellum-specific peptidoglycan hydrolase FlgJ
VVAKPGKAYERAFAIFAKAAADELVKRGFKINPTVCACQTIQETGYGTSNLARIDHNYFGIKALGRYTGRRSQSGVYRGYTDWWASFFDYGVVVGRGKAYIKAQENKDDALRCLEEIQVVGYAEDADYVSEVRKVSATFPKELGVI